MNFIIRRLETQVEHNIRLTIDFGSEYIFVPN